MPEDQAAALEEMSRRRSEASAAIVSSAAQKRLIVAGPGTGKSFTFQQALKAVGGDGLALTFIRNLVRDLATDLDGLAEVFTFHGYCKYLMHRHDVAGLQAGDYYPPLPEVIVEDILIRTGRVVKTQTIEARLQNLDTSDGLIDEVLAQADYYNAVSHTDLVYRVLGFFEAVPDSIPTYPLIVVDEFQDFSLLETTFIALLGDKSRVLIAGDDDQALYKQLRHASPDFIRALAADDDYAVFELPYCSRCTSVIVAAVRDLLDVAIKAGNLQGRIPKNFDCYLPDKGAESAAHPKIIHAKISSANTPYIGGYISQQIARIPPEDIARSREKGYPTALVIGPRPFLNKAFDVVVQNFPSARMKTSDKIEIDVLAGYKRIAGDDQSRLGWRIVVSARPFDGDQATLRAVFDEAAELAPALPEEYRDEHLELARLVGVLIEGGALSEDEEQRLTTAVERSMEAISAFLGTDEDPESTPSDDDVDLSEPDILFTSLVGAKGLSAEHVFIVGMNNGHFPRDRDNVSDEDVCKMLVALSRTRKQCHVVSAGFFGSGQLEQSVFLNVLKPHLRTVTVKKGGVPPVSWISDG
ncbi:AAA family ATPase [Paraconexibacter antarcticus]|uniref:AAA family ATPase n=1 Tax=Paraconexibacter antarcticus TaxID=2949664 RepID=A0ABY5DYF2_9ACTN|nr:UvrD-helicase domain-containing protein [Paraconexibacter antarcticus]UTI67055.1 AAA family ATPase [Paraconexibacter antarcticus]